MKKCIEIIYKASTKVIYFHSVIQYWLIILLLLLKFHWLNRKYTYMYIYIHLYVSNGVKWCELVSIILVKAQCCPQQPQHLVDSRHPDAKIELPNLQSANLQQLPLNAKHLSVVCSTLVEKEFPNFFLKIIRCMDSLYVYLLMWMSL